MAKTKYQFALTQTFELACQRQYRARAGMAQLDRTQWSIEQAAVATIAETERRYFEALYRHELLDVNQSMADLNAKLLGVLERQFKAGTASAADVSLARIETRSLQQQAAVAKTQYVSALQNLRVHLGLERSEPIEVNGGWTNLNVPLGLIDSPLLRPGPDDAGERSESRGADASEIERLAVSRPDVLAADADLNEANAQLQLAQANLTPNVVFGPKYERDESNTQFLGLVAEMNLGARYTSKGVPLVRQQCAEVRRRQIARDQLALKARMEIQAAVARYRVARACVDQFDGGERDSLAREVDIVTNLFEAGQTDLLNVFAARKAALQLRISRAEAFNELGHAVAEWTSAAGILPEPQQLDAPAN